MDIAFLGIDGVGKSTIINSLVPMLRSRGYDPKIVTWRRAMRDSENPFVRDTLRDLYVGTFRTMFGWADQEPSEKDIWKLFPSESQTFIDTGIEDLLGKLSLTSNATAGLVATALVELAGNFFLKHHEIDRLRVNHDIVIQETFGYKHIVKELLIAREIINEREEPFAASIVQNILELAERCFMSWLQPTYGFFVRGSPQMAYEWRLKQSGRVGLIEDFGLASQHGRDSFVNLQTACDDIFNGYATKCGWPIIEMQDRPIELNIGHANDVVLTTIGA
ncbi:hypothetical protein HFN01_08585 [Rhizobium leguminosarum]|uniref:hypothetical protein n=1 Tax=Rhizobium leguminosarum TaxID=384 RepID=UPI001C961C17|nr:hypothetical protein [Rhizobium leguminosarum]MBY5394885.1 hypothetical protein [Rhizobium leguminosarum]